MFGLKASHLSARLFPFNRERPQFIPYIFGRYLSKSRIKRNPKNYNFMSASLGKLCQVAAVCPKTWLQFSKAENEERATLKREILLYAPLHFSVPSFYAF